MEKWPGWSAPLLGVIGGSLGGLALAGDPKNHFPGWQTSLAGAVAGLAAGLIVWGFDRRDPGPKRLRETASIRIARIAVRKAPRWAGFCLLAVGLSCLGVNHAFALYAQKKFLPLVICGAFFSAVGLGGMILPQLLSTATASEKTPWWVHVLGGVLAIGGLAVGFYLWLWVY
jgi:hypothetical protein